MAGIGFILRRLAKKDSLSGMAYAYFHGILASSAPWIATVIALGTIYLLTKTLHLSGGQEVFRAIVLYNFCFSLVFSATLTVIATRYIADHIYQRDLSSVPAMFFKVLLLNAILVLPIVVWFYGFYTDLTLINRILAVINFYLCLFIWLSTVFISTLKTYKGVSFSFIGGMAIGVFFAFLFANSYGSTGMLIGFNFGLLIVVASLIALLLVEYPKCYIPPKNFFSFFKKHIRLALSGTFYTLAIWVDKWILWTAPEAERLPSGFWVYTNYDNAMFIAYLTVIPSLAMFLISQETAFYERYIKYYKDILNNANYSKIRENQEKLMGSIHYHGRNLMIMQFGIAAIVILFAPKIFALFSINYIQLSIFRFGVIGASFQILSLFLIITNSYFENRKVLDISLLFFISNVLFTLITLKLGFPYYGIGYCLSCILTFVYSAILLEEFVRMLPYHTFITTNEAVNYKDSID